DRSKFVYEPKIFANELPNLEKMQAIFEQYNPKKDFSNLFLGKMDREILLNLTHVDGKKPNPMHTDFVQISNLKNLDGGCMTYANFLANRFFADKYCNSNEPDCCEDQASSKPSETEKKLPKIVKNDYVNEFFREYEFFNKRLPVVKVQYETSGDKRLYIEFATGKLAASVENSQAWEGLSFAYFHKYHLFEFLGKTPRDLIMMVFALGNLLVACLGLKMFIARKLR
ncbi:MAG: hypothetical protein EAZ95_16470, partial [Bacteroidetes bacterium]